MASVVVDPKQDPLVGFNFMFEVGGGKITGFFTEVSGLGSEHTIIEHKVMTKDGKELVRKIPGRLKWGDIVLKRGITDNMDMWKWRKQVEEGKVAEARMNGSVVMYDQEGKERARWDFFSAWPAKISGPTPKSDSDEIGIEELTIAHEFIERKK
jgi:phage tail-like protein